MSRHCQRRIIISRSKCQKSPTTAITPWTYLVLTTRGASVDAEGLPALLETPAAYIGVIGSRRRWATTCNLLKEKGILPEKIARVKSPIGLELNAETPEEIAVSILAEIIQMRRGGRVVGNHVAGGSNAEYRGAEITMWKEIISPNSAGRCPSRMGESAVNRRGLSLGGTDLILELERGVRTGIGIEP